ncbi:MAG TPA: RNA-binding cell elongation regulator Jag/EloR [Chloroflexota bacterium]|jgi:spoIIIJ-associated protein|nr:RNA-binding cell elongation regulator Jag/EloR [Chloroflexota bacterium]
MEGESLEVSAKTVAEAIKKATQLTGRPEEELQITVLSEGSRGVLGIGGQDAHILVSVGAASPAAAVAAVPIGPTTHDEVEEAAATVDEAAARARAAPPSEEIADEARMVLLDLLDLMSMDTDVEIHQGDASFVLEVVGEDLGLLIGRRGETLSALQFLLNLILAKRLKKWARVIVDVEGYRARREQTLSGLAHRIAFRVRETGQPIALEAMPANERRIIHLALADNPHVTTGSVGEGDQRKVVISPKR